MKKLFTLIIGVFSLSAVFAQYDHDDRDRDYDHGQSSIIINRDYHGYDHDYDNHDNRYMMRRAVERINWKYDHRIAEVQNDPFINPWRKDRIINNLERQRHEEIRSIYGRFGGRRDRDWD